MPNAETDEPRVPRPVSAINPKWRWLAIVLGLGGLGAGGYATFTTTTEGGPVAMMLVGLIFMFIAMGGQLPSRLKIGDNDVTWRGAVGDYVAETISGATPEEKPAEIQRVSELASVAPELAVYALSKAALREAAREMVVSVVDAMQDAHLGGRASRHAGPHVLLVEGDNGGRVVVDVRPPVSESDTKSLHSETPRHWAVLYVRLEAGPVEHLNLVTTPAATFVLRPEDKRWRDSLRGVLQRLLVASSERKLEIAREEEILKSFISGK